MDLAVIIGRVTGFNGRIVNDPGKPDGTFRKLMDSSRMRNSGWKPEIMLEDGIRSTYKEYLAGIRSALA